MNPISADLYRKLTSSLSRSCSSQYRLTLVCNTLGCHSFTSRKCCSSTNWKSSVNRQRWMVAQSKHLTTSRYYISNDRWRLHKPFYQPQSHYSSDGNGSKKSVTALFIPVPVKSVNTNPDDINIGEELGGSLKNKKGDKTAYCNVQKRSSWKDCGWGGRVEFVLYSTSWM